MKYTSGSIQTSFYGPFFCLSFIKELKRILHQAQVFVRNKDFHIFVSEANDEIIFILYVQEKWKKSFFKSKMDLLFILHINP